MSKYHYETAKFYFGQILQIVAFEDFVVIGEECGRHVRPIGEVNHLSTFGPDFASGLGNEIRLLESIADLLSFCLDPAGARLKKLGFQAEVSGKGPAALNKGQLQKKVAAKEIDPYYGVAMRCLVYRVKRGPYRKGK